MRSFQERFHERYSHCVGCGSSRTDGLGVRSYWSLDEADVAVAHVDVDPRLHGGDTRVMYGGVIASLIDCHSAATADATKAEQLGLDPNGPVPRFVTASLTVDYREPTPMGPVDLRATVTSLEGRKAHVTCELIADGRVTATGHSLMIQIDDA